MANKPWKLEIVNQPTDNLQVYLPRAIYLLSNCDWINDIPLLILKRFHKLYILYRDSVYSIKINAHVPLKVQSLSNSVSLSLCTSSPLSPSPFLLRRGGVAIQTALYKLQDS